VELETVFPLRAFNRVTRTDPRRQAGKRYAITCALFGCTHRSGGKEWDSQRQTAGAETVTIFHPFLNANLVFPR